jgi:hypothetical protein
LKTQAGLRKMNVPLVSYQDFSENDFWVNSALMKFSRENKSKKIPAIVWYILVYI